MYQLSDDTFPTPLINELAVLAPLFHFPVRPAVKGQSPISGRGSDTATMSPVIVWCTISDISLFNSTAAWSVAKRHERARVTTVVGFARGQVDAERSLLPSFALPLFYCSGDDATSRPDYFVRCPIYLFSFVFFSFNHLHY